MFGHPDDNTAPQNASAPAPDAGLGGDNASPAGPPPAPTDGTNDYIMTDPATSDPSTSLPPVQQPTESTTAPVPDDLLDIKQQALQQLSPLVGHLDQPPEEEFRTTMMMIQAADDQALIPKAYEAAQKIVDEKTKAQALLDIVNEINYFTQVKDNEQKHADPAS